MKKFLMALVFGMALLNGELYGAKIEIIPPSQQVGIGSSFDVELFISELGDFAAPSISTYDLDVSFDLTVVSFDRVVFGDPVLGNQLDLFGFGTVSSELPGVGAVNLFELSLDLPGDLDSNQAGSFVLATLRFDAISAGTSQLSLTTNVVGDSLGNPLATTVGNGSVEVEAIPEPSTFVLLGMGVVAAVIGHRRKKTS